MSEIRTVIQGYHLVESLLSVALNKIDQDDISRTRDILVDALAHVRQANATMEALHDEYCTEEPEIDVGNYQILPHGERFEDPLGDDLMNDWSWKPDVA